MTQGSVVVAESSQRHGLALSLGATFGWLLWIGLYLRLALPIGGSVVPGIVAFPAAFAVAALTNHAVNLRALVAPSAIMAVAGLSLIWAPDATLYLEERTKSLALLLCALITAGTVAKMVGEQEPRTLFKYAYGALLVLVVGVALEVTTPLGALSDMFREVLYRGQFVYASDDRDLLLHGAVRPKLFTQEPSHVAKAIGLAAVVAFATAGRLSGKVAVILLAGCGAWITRSPSLVLVLPLLAVGVWSRLERTLSAPLRWGLLAAVLAGGIAAASSWRAVVQALPAGRVAEIVAGSDPSTVMRVVAPYSAAVAIVREYPVFGVGVGGKESAFGALRKAYAAFPSILIDGFSQNASVGWNNALAELPIFFGLLGSVLLVICVAWVGHSWCGVGVVTSLSSFVVIFNADAGVVSYLPWSYWAMFLATLGAMRSKPVVVVARDSDLGAT